MSFSSYVVHLKGFSPNELFMETLCIKNGEIFKNILKRAQKKMCPCECTMAMGKVGSGRKYFWEENGVGRMSQGHF